MGEIIPVHNGMRVYNVQKYFLDDWTYVEEFDTEDGTHWRAECTPDEYPQEVIDILAEVDAELEKEFGKDEEGSVP